MKGKQHYKRLPSLDIPTVLHYDAPKSFEALVEEYESERPQKEISFLWKARVIHGSSVSNGQRRVRK